MKFGMSMLAAGALVLGTTAISASAAITFFEDAGIFSEPTGALEDNGESGFFAAWDRYGRTVAGAEVISDSTISKIQPILWGNDADLWQITVTDYTNFKAYVKGGHTLALFDASGNAIAAAVGTPQHPAGLIDSSWLSSNGTYYLGLAVSGSVPQNDAGDPLFTLTPGAAVGPNALGDTTLSSDPFVAWSKNNGAYLIGPGNFGQGNSTVNLAIPEPASLTLLGLGGLAMFRRR